MTEPVIKSETPPSSLLVDLGPLILFLVAYWMTNIFMATLVFMVATAAAVGWSLFKHGKATALLLFSAAMVLIFGGLTLVFQNESFIKVKPTIYYAVVAIILFSGIYTKKPTLKLVMGAAYPELSDRGWHILTRNFAFFFVAMAVANELVWRNSSTGFWLGYKLWGALPATLIFGMCHVPMILRNSGDHAEPIA